MIPIYFSFPVYQQHIRKFYPIKNNDKHKEIVGIW